MSVLPSTAYIAEIFTLITGDTPYLALYTSNPNADNSGTEVTGGSYARQALTFTQVGAQLQNNAEERFTLPTATVTHYGILDASSGGNLKIYGAISSTVAVVLDDEIVFPAGSITINLAGS